MSDAHTWVRNPATGGVWACPNDSLPRQLVLGWEKCDAPVEDESHLHDPRPVAKKAAESKKSGD